LWNTSADEKEKGKGAVINVENGIWQAIGGIGNAASSSSLKLECRLIEILPAETATDSL
jgi:hypothetical protein